MDISSIISLSISVILAAIAIYNFFTNRATKASAKFEIFAKNVDIDSLNKRIDELENKLESHSIELAVQVEKNENEAKLIEKLEDKIDQIIKALK